ncbi:hypothetical protein PVAP13_9KG158085 [Panicum virgatum]|uniref:Uncharacterized protein n=1 Tax=Panicum virgatum TaxID=38727 RepID=A0A8T0NFX8_PANVG|nr:hypothetical protein PVAP13_9KG158085 [Panicum virgatum]
MLCGVDVALVVALGDGGAASREGVLARYRALRARTGRTSTPSPSSARRRPSSPGCARAGPTRSPAGTRCSTARHGGGGAAAARRRNAGHGGQTEGAGAAAAGRPHRRGRGRRPAQGRKGGRAPGEAAPASRKERGGRR